MELSRSAYPKKKLPRILKYLRPYLGLEIGVSFVMLMVVALALLDPLVLKILIDDVLVDRNASLLNILIIALVVLFLLRGVLNIISNYLIHFVSQRVLFDVRCDLFQHLERLHIDFFTKTKTGEIISRVNNDVARVQNILTSTLITLITDVVTLLVILVIIFYLDWKLSLISLTLFPPFFMSQLYLGRKIRRKSREARDKSAEIVSFFQESFSAIKLIQSFVMEKFEAMRLLRKSRELINVRIYLGVLGALAASIAGFLSALGPVLVLLYGGHQVIRGNFTIGALVAFYAYIGRLFGPVFRLAQHNVSIQSALASVDRIFEFFDIESPITDIPGSAPLKVIRGQIVFENVSFSYDDNEPVLEDVSFRIQPRQKVAIVGPSGVGKTTIIDLLCRFYEPQSGSILLDGRDIRNIRLKSLRKNIGIVSQETILFNASIRENILYGRRRATEVEMIDAARRANIHDFVDSLPEKYETIAGERGVRLSGGQCQRLSIARTILKSPEILVLDEAMSSLDSRSEALIHEALEPLMRNKTAVIVAHRLSSITDCDNIFVLHERRIKESGRHEELLSHGGIYKMLWDQLSRRKDSSQSS